MARGDHYRAQADGAEKSAAEVKDAEMKRQFLELAERWRVLARQADEHDAIMDARHKHENGQDRA